MSVTLVKVVRFKDFFKILFLCEVVCVRQVPRAVLELTVGNHRKNSSIFNEVNRPSIASLNEKWLALVAVSLVNKHGYAETYALFASMDDHGHEDANGRTQQKDADSG